MWKKTFKFCETQVQTMYETNAQVKIYTQNFVLSQTKSSVESRQVSIES